MNKPKQKKQLPFFNLFLLGYPGAGKATQGKIFAKKFNLYDLDMGVEQHRLRKTNKELDALFKKSVDKGKMNPTGVYRKILSSALDRIPKNKAILFDGHPKMPNEVIFLSKILKKQGRTNNLVIFLEVPWQVCRKRALNRQHGYDGNKRADDTEKAVKERYYNARKWIKLAKPVYTKLYPITTVSGVGTVDTVTKRIDTALKKLITQLHEKRNAQNSK